MRAQVKTKKLVLLLPEGQFLLISLLSKHHRDLLFQSKMVTLLAQLFCLKMVQEFGKGCNAQL